MRYRTLFSRRYAASLRSSLPFVFSPCGKKQNSKGQLQSEMAVFLSLRAFHPTDTLSFRKTYENACFFIAFCDYTSIIALFLKIVKRF
jgi:hypothetical protein